MMIQVHTDNHVEGSDELSAQVQSELEATLARFADQITRVEVHINDTNSEKKSGSNDKRCQMEARLAGLQPISVTHLAASIEEAVDGCAEKLARTLEKTIDKLGDHKGRTSFGGDQTI